MQGNIWKTCWRLFCSYYFYYYYFACYCVYNIFKISYLILTSCPYICERKFDRFTSVLWHSSYYCQYFLLDGHPYYLILNVLTLSSFARSSHQISSLKNHSHTIISLFWNLRVFLVWCGIPFLVRTSYARLKYLGLFLPLL